jgi:hypothetical protein
MDRNRSSLTMHLLREVEAAGAQAPGESFWEWACTENQPNGIRWVWCRVECRPKIPRKFPGTRFCAIITQISPEQPRRLCERGGMSGFSAKRWRDRSERLLSLVTCQ